MRTRMSDSDGFLCFSQLARKESLGEGKDHESKQSCSWKELYYGYDYWAKSLTCFKKCKPFTELSVTFVGLLDYG